VTENSRVTASKDGFSSKDTTIKVTLGKKNSADFYLDFLPMFISCTVNTLHKSNSRYYAFFETEVHDSDGTGLEDIAAVSLFISGYSDTIDLKYYEPNGMYRRKIRVFQRTPYAAL
jgi:hypothetical protein